MASMNMVEQLEEKPPAKKPRIENPEEQRKIANSNEAAFPKSTEPKEEEPDNSTKDLLNRRHSHRPLPLELNCEIFKCFKLATQGKFIWGLGRGIYGMFGRKLLLKTKRMRNPPGNRWLGRNRTNLVISEDGLSFNANTRWGHNVIAEKGFHISGDNSRVDDFPGTILYYYEVSVLSWHDGIYIGLCGGGTRNDGTPFGCWHESSYVIETGDRTATSCWLAGETHRFELPEGVSRRHRPEMQGFLNVVGCGLVMDPDNKVAIFFTLNGKLLGKQIPINPSVFLLYPTVRMPEFPSVFLHYPIVRMPEFYTEANFGDDPAKPFEYDVHNCPELELACI